MNYPFVLTPGSSGAVANPFSVVDNDLLADWLTIVSTESTMRRFLGLPDLTSKQISVYGITVVSDGPCVVDFGLYDSADTSKFHSLYKVNATNVASGGVAKGVPGDAGVYFPAGITQAGTGVSGAWKFGIKITYTGDPPTVTGDIALWWRNES